MGVEGKGDGPSVKLFQTMAYANSQVPLGNPDVEGLFRRRRAEFNRRMNRRYRVPLFVVLIALPLPLIFVLYTGSACCTAGLVAGVVCLYLAVIIFIGFGYMVEEPEGYWKRGDKGYDSTIRDLEKMLADEMVTYEKVDVARFFQVQVDTTFYMLNVVTVGSTPAYIILWRDGDSALVHLGPRSGFDPEWLKKISKKLAWAV